MPVGHFVCVGTATLILRPGVKPLKECPDEEALLDPKAALHLWNYQMLGLQGGFRDLFQSNFFLCKETNSLGVCELFLNHTFQSRDKSPDSSFSHFSAVPKCWYSSCVAVDKEIEIVSGTTGVANGHRRS